jgi:hypothetical protein
MYGNPFPLKKKPDPNTTLAFHQVLFLMDTTFEVSKRQLNRIFAEIEKVV